MSKKIAVLALVVCCSLSLASTANAGRVACINTFGRGTLAFISTGEPGDPPLLILIEGGFGGDPDICFSNPSACTIGPCRTDDVSCDVDDLVIGDCYDFEASSFTLRSSFSIYNLEYVSAGSCP